MTFAMIARCDGGGLAALTREVHRQLKPERTLLLDLETRGRGDCTPDEYLEGEVYRCTFAGSIPDRAVEWVTAPGIDTLWCVDEETEILSRRGWLRYDEVTTADEVMTLTEGEHLGEWQPVTDVTVFPAETRRMLSIESRGHSSLTTEGHRWFVQHQYTGAKPHHVWKGNRVRTSGELTGADRIPRAAPCVNIPNEAKHTDAMVELIAWYYTEGTCSPGRTMTICQSHVVNPSNCARIRAALHQLFGPAVAKFSRNGRNKSGSPAWRETMSDRECRWMLNADARDIVLALVPGTDKIVPIEFVQQLTASQLRLFLDVSMLADNNGPRAFSQVVPERLDALELACILLGIGVSRRKSRHGEDMTVGLYKNQYMYLDMARRNWVDHDGIVWCPTTPNGSWLARRRGTIFYTGNSAETFYDDHKLIPRAHGNGIRTVVYAMPELAPWTYDSSIPVPRLITVPTSWRLDTMPANTQLLPMPVARDRLPADERREVKHLYHVQAAAMLDRNGTQILLDALEHIVSDDLTLTIRVNGDGPSPMVPVGTRVHIEVVMSPEVDYWDSYPEGIDLLVQPRRYGGLSLPVQECASLGVPTVCLATDPYASEAFTTTIPATSARDSRMKGGMVPVQSGDPRSLARAIDYLVEHPEVQHTASIEAGVWAESHSWAGPLGDRWCATLGCERR